MPAGRSYGTYRNPLGIEIVVSKDMDLDTGLQQSIGDPGALQIDGKSQGVLQRKMNKFVGVQC